MQAPRKLRSAETIFADGEAYFGDLLTDIRAAVSTVDMETYIFNSDSVGEQFISVLSDARTRGVRVRLLVDGAGIPLLANSFIQRLRQADVELRLFHPFPWRIWLWKHANTDNPFIAKILQLIAGINHRNHRKTCLIDRNIIWVGSFNISKVHLPAEQGGKDWRDTAVRLSSADTLELEMAFARAWRHKFDRSRRTLAKIIMNSPFRLNYSRRRRRLLNRDLLYRIDVCRSRIWITNAYFVPDGTFLQHISRAAARGVDVRIILPSKSDVFFMPWTSSMFYLGLLKHGIRIFEYQAGILHAKTLIIDDWMTVGSSNLNSRSFLHDLEVDVVLRTEGCRKELNDQFLADLRHSKEIFQDGFLKRAFWKRFFGRLILYARYWI